MKKYIVLVLLSVFIFVGCSAQTPQETTLTGQINIDESLFDSDWEAVDLSAYSDMQSYLLYYTNKENPEVYSVMTLAPHYEDAVEDLQSELEKNIESYTQTTIPYSTYESEIGDLNYSDIGGFPACSFEVKGKLGSADSEFSAQTIFVSTPKGIYCLQMQGPTQNFSDYSEFFTEIENSLSAS